MELLRLATAGSVDDGKSSLIGRLLFDSKAIFEDQLRAVERASRGRGSDQIELALLTDGLRAEREQNITIDVAYRYFATPRRKFVIADTPGHVQYTRNMVTGASTADLSVILVDARKGVLEQSRRHTAISALLGVGAVVFAVNKMDLVDFAKGRFEELEVQLRAIAAKLGIASAVAIPISALYGDNVVEPSERTPWYHGPTLLGHLESVEIDESARTSGLRLPVQLVIRPDQSFRGIAGQIEAGIVAVGDRVVALPSMREATIATLRTPSGEAHSAGPGQAVTASLSEELDIGRGDMLVSPAEPPAVTRAFEAVLCWMGDGALRPGDRLLLLHTTRRVFAYVERVLRKVDLETLDDRPADALGPNDLGEVAIRTSEPVFLDAYRANRATGSFVLVDPGTYRTVAAGMVRATATADGQERPRPGLVLWLSGATPERRRQIARSLLESAHWRGLGGFHIDEEAASHELNADTLDRFEARRRIGAVARLARDQGLLAIATLDLNEDERQEAASGGELVAFLAGEGSPAEENGVLVLPEALDVAWLAENVLRQAGAIEPEYNL